jgi:hypothetical protein
MVRGVRAGQNCGDLLCVVDGLAAAAALGVCGWAELPEQRCADDSWLLTSPASTGKTGAMAMPHNCPE